VDIFFLKIPVAIRKTRFCATSKTLSFILFVSLSQNVVLVLESLDDVKEFNIRNISSTNFGIGRKIVLTSYMLTAHNLWLVDHKLKTCAICR